MKKSADKDIKELIGSCRTEDLKLPDPDSRKGKLAARMKDGKIQKSCLTIKDIQRIIQGG